MMGMEMPDFSRNSWKSSPFTPGRRTSSTKQLGASGRGALQKSSVEGKTCAARPTDSSKLLIASRTEASSSTTKIVGGDSGIGLSWLNRQCELENGSARGTRNCPQVTLDQSLDHRESHADAVRL